MLNYCLKINFCELSFGSNCRSRNGNLLNGYGKFVLAFKGWYLKSIKNTKSISSQPKIIRLVLKSTTSLETRTKRRKRTQQICF